MSRDDDFSDWAAAATPRLLRLARLMAADDHAGEDLTQEVLERVYVKWSRIEDPSAYAHRALANAATSRWRRRARRPAGVAWNPAAETAAPGNDVDVVDGRAEALAILRRLPARQRAVLVLRYLEDSSEQDISELLGIGVGTVKSHTARALTTLRNQHLDSPTSAPQSRAMPARIRASRQDGA